MFASKFPKYLLILAIVFCSSCGYWQSQSNSNSSADQPETAEIPSEIPFATREPETYQAEMITTIEGVEEKTFIARSKGRFFSREGEVANLRTAANKSFLINFAKRIYVENGGPWRGQSGSSGETPNDFLRTQWLNQKTAAEFESLGVEKGLSKYRTSFERSESLIFVDENYRIPVRQEFYSVEGAERILRMTIELRNISLVADERLFEVPKDFRMVSISEFTK